jgi:Zn-dependent alcohol dehydrogenase
MKALVLNALGHGFDVEDVEIAAPRSREVLVDVQASGLCHTDLLFATHDIAPTPSVLGHEVAGIVAAVGPDVTHARVGDHVVGFLAQSCGACARCLSGRPFQCQHPESTLRRPDEPAVLAVAVPVSVFLGLMCTLSYYLVRRFHVVQTWSLIATAGVVAVTLVAALSGVDVARCLVILMLAPTVTVVGSEVRVLPS